MGRTQIYLGDEELAALERATHETGASRSELIRRAVRSVYGDGRRDRTRDRDQELRAKYGPPERSVEEQLANLRAAAGIWKDRNFTGEEYVRAIRSGDMNANLRRLGVE